MATSRIGLSFSINNFPIKKDFDVRVNVKEEFNYLRYGSSFGLRNVGVSYIDSEPVNTLDNIIINDLTYLVPENSPLKLSEEIYLSSMMDLPDGDFIITDIFKTTSLEEEVPLYLRHSLDKYTNISDIEVLDGNFNPVNSDLFLYANEESTLGYPRKSIYTNLNCSFDLNAQSYTIYYARFKDIVTGKIVVELLNSKVFYLKNTFSTPTNQRSYSVTPRFGLARINIYFDSQTYSPTPQVGSQRFSIKIKNDNRISVLRPSNLDATEKWYLKINPGEFFKNTVDGDARYYVPEYENQLFSPVAPFKLMVEKKARIVTSKLIYLDPTPIANLGIDGFFIYIILKDVYGRTVRALTNDPAADIYFTPEGTATDIFYEKDTIDSIAEQDGFIRLKSDISTDLTAYVTYRYIEDYYLYRGISVNSTINPNILNNKIVVYTKPEFTEFDLSGNVIPLSVLTETTFHLLIDENDLILDSNESDNFQTITGSATSGTLSTLIDTSLSSTDYYTNFELEILSGENAGRKLKIDSYNTLTKTITVAEPFEESIAAETRYRINKKFNAYTTLDPVSSVLFTYIGWKDTYTISPYHYILLADVFAIQTLSPQNISKTDIRIRGGGINLNNLDNALKLQDEAQWYWDVGYWDGQQYPGMGALLVNLPRSILKEVGGDFSREQVEETTIRHMPSGYYPIIRYYDRSTRITNIIPKNKSIFVEWLDVDAGGYNVYVGQNPDQLSIYRTVAGVIDSLLIEDLDNDKIYYIMVESIVSGVKQLPSRKAYAIPFNSSNLKSGAIYGLTLYGEGTYTNG